MIEKTLILLKPDSVKRGLIGKILERFENVGLKIVGMKMIHINKEFAEKHYTDDIAKRHGEHVRNWLIDFITEDPVIAIVLEGIEAVEKVRNLVGETEPKSANPGTIRGDFSHVSYGYADQEKKSIRNLVHASGNQEEAKYEVNLWFSNGELFSYENIHGKIL